MRQSLKWKFRGLVMNKLTTICAAVFFLVGCESIAPTLDIDAREISTEAVADVRARASFWESFRPTLERAGGQLGAGRTVVAQEELVRAPVVSDAIPDSYPDTPVSVTMRDVDVREVLNVMRSVAGVNMVVSSEVSGATSVAIADVPWRSAMETILSSNRLGFRTMRGSNVMEIYTLAELSEIEAAELARARQSILLRGLRDGETYKVTTAFHRVRYADIQTVAQQVGQLFGTSSDEAGSQAEVAVPTLVIVPDLRTNSVMLRGLDHEVVAASDLLERLDVPTQQVLIEAIVVEASQNFGSALGARLGIDLSSGDVNAAGLQGGAAGQALGSAAGSIFDYTGNSNAGVGIIMESSALTLRAEITALQEEGISRIVSNPRVYVVDNSQARIFQGIEIPYESSGSEGGEPTFKEAGLSLVVTPTITGDGHVFLDVQINKDSPNYSQSATVPSIDKSEVSTRLLVADGAVAVIGGIKETSASENQENLPGAARRFRNIFGGSASDTSERELIIFLIPRIQ